MPAGRVARKQESQRQQLKGRNVTEPTASPCPSLDTFYGAWRKVTLVTAGTLVLHTVQQDRQLERRNTSVAPGHVK